MSELPEGFRPRIIPPPSKILLPPRLNPTLENARTIEEAREAVWLKANPDAGPGIARGWHVEVTCDDETGDCINPLHLKLVRDHA